MSKVNPIVQSFRSQPLAWMVQTVGVIFFIGNLYMATQLFPLIRNIDGIAAKVSAIEKTQEANLPYVIDYIEFKTGVAKDIEEMKEDIDAIAKVHGIK